MRNRPGLWLAAFIALIGVLLLFDRVAHAEAADVPGVGVGVDDPDDDTIDATRDDTDDPDDVRAATTLVTPPPIDDPEPTHARPSRFGRLDLALLWRHEDRDPQTLAPYGYDEVLLVATWRR